MGTRLNAGKRLNTGLRLNIGLKLKAFEIFLDAWAMAEVLLAIVAQTYTNPGRRRTNPEIKARNKRRGMRSGRRFGVTVTRED